MEKICKICGNKIHEKKVEKDGKEYLLCENCGVTFMFPYPTKEELKKYYENDYTNMRIEGTGLHIRFKDEYIETNKRNMDMTFHDLNFDFSNYSGKKLLDIGCANGIFINYMKDYELDSLGIDISEDMVNMAKNRGLNCISGDFNDIDEKFDIITIWDVIEHVTNPVKLIQKAYSLLNDHGILFIQTPCTGLISDGFGEKWRNYIVPQHIFLFSQESLFSLLEKNRFRVDSWFRVGSGNTAGMIPELQKRIFDKIVKKYKIGDTITLRASKI